MPVYTSLKSSNNDVFYSAAYVSILLACQVHFSRNVAFFRVQRARTVFVHSFEMSYTKFD